MGDVLKLLIKVLRIIKLMEEYLFGTHRDSRRDFPFPPTDAHIISMSDFWSVVLSEY